VHRPEKSVKSGAYAEKREKSVAVLIIGQYTSKKQNLRRRRRRRRRRRYSPSPPQLNRKNYLMKTGRRRLRASTLRMQWVVKKCGVLLL
jgi:hypothetical protein